MTMLLQRLMFLPLVNPWKRQTTKHLVPCVNAVQLAGYSSSSNVKERTLIAVKPDGVQRRLVGQIIRRFEQRGFQLVSGELLSQHYSQLTQKPFYPSLEEYMTSAPVVVMVWEGHNVIQTSRAMVGPTNPAVAPAGTVRGDFSLHVSRNVVHASDSLEGAQREIQLWFQPKELVKWDCWDQTLTSEE
ncbi:nucleoside diphosphate kinase, mitochondrial isoform X2 [Stigmatopora nigra]